MSIEKYTNLDLNKFEQELFQGVSDESRMSSIKLSSEYGPDAPGAGFTLHMKSCFNGHIAPNRSLAISIVNHQARQIKLDGDDEGVIELIAVHNAERDRAERIQDVTESFNTSHSDLIIKAKDNEKQYRRIKNSEGGREAKTPSKIL